MQFALQTQAYKMQFPDARNCVVEIEERTVGRLLVNRAETEIRLIDIAFLPEFRGLGAGKILIENLQREAETASKPLGLRVLTTNASAIRLYERLGFVVTENNQTHLTMRWSGFAEKFDGIKGAITFKVNRTNKKQSK
jgi:ribosomal protein S18 acetylase RimI-like enzyme